MTNATNAWLFDSKFCVDAALNQPETLAGLIKEELFPGVMFTLLKLQRGRYSLVEEKIPPGARAVGTRLRSLPLPEHGVIAAVIREGEIIMPRGETIFAEGDVVLAITDRPGAEALAKLFTVRE